MTDAAIANIIEAAVAPLRARIEQLEAQLKSYEAEDSGECVVTAEALEEVFSPHTLAKWRAFRAPVVLLSDDGPVREISQAEYCKS